METKDVLVIKKEAAQTSGGWRPISVAEEYYFAIREISEQTNLPIGKVTGMMLAFALERLVVEN